MRLALTIFALILLASAALGAGRPPAVTSYAQMTMELHAAATQSPCVSLASLGQSARGRKDLWLVRIADPKVPPQSTVRIMVLCRQHGDEPASTEAALKLIHGLTAGHDPRLQSDLKQVSLYLVPMVNPDGADAMTRRNGAGADLNRDWGVFSQPETKAVAQAARLIRPQIIVDAHNWDGGRSVQRQLRRGRQVRRNAFRTRHPCCPAGSRSESFGDWVSGEPDDIWRGTRPASRPSLFHPFGCAVDASRNALRRPQRSG